MVARPAFTSPLVSSAIKLQLDSHCAFFEGKMCFKTQTHNTKETNVNREVLFFTTLTADIHLRNAMQKSILEIQKRKSAVKLVALYI